MQTTSISTSSLVLVLARKDLTSKNIHIHNNFEYKVLILPIDFLSLWQINKNKVMTIVILIIIVVVIIGAVVVSNANSATKEEETKEEETKERRRLLAERFQKEAEVRESKEKQLMLEEEAKYGKCTKVIKWWFDNKTVLIRVFEDSRTIFIKDKEYKFNDLIGVSYVDEISNVVRVATTHTDTKNMAGRAIVGGLIAGGLGAAVGAVTAKQQTSYSNDTPHDYVIIINTKDLSNPLVKLKISNNLMQVNEVMATINAVIAYNQK